MRAQIIGTGSCLPEKIVTNDFLSTIVDTSDEWISSRTGIRQRHIAVEETTASMSTEAGRRALESAGVKAEELDLIIVATCTPDTLVPNTACLVQSELGAVNAVAFDISAACSGFVFALNLVDAYMQAGVPPEKRSQLLSLAIFTLLLPEQEAEVFSTLPARVILMRRLPPDCAVLLLVGCSFAVCQLTNLLLQRDFQETSPGNLDSSRLL